MKFVYSFLAISLMSISAMASCPDLTGKWACKNADGDILTYLELNSIHTTEVDLLVTKTKLNSGTQADIYYLDRGQNRNGDVVYSAACSPRIVRFKMTDSNGTSEFAYKLRSRNHMVVEVKSPVKEVKNCEKFSFEDSL